jgi:hypothetical protein
MLEPWIWNGLHLLNKDPDAWLKYSGTWSFGAGDEKSGFLFTPRLNKRLFDVMWSLI